MVTILVIIGSIILLVVALCYYLVYLQKPKTFRGNLKSLEQSLYNELAGKLSAPGGPLVTQQLAYLKRGTRLYFAKSYTLELYENRDHPLPADILFNRTDEFRLAGISFTAGGIKYKAEFNTYAGRVWGMTVRPSPKKIINRKLTSFDRFTIYNDPMEKLDLEIKTEYYTDADTNHFTGLLQQLKENYPLTNIKKPLPEKQQQLFTRLSETRLPEDYIELCSQTNGFEINDVTVFGLGEYQLVPMQAASYLVLAEKEGGCLAIKQTKRITALKCFSYEDETDVKQMGADFLDALKRFIAL